MHALSESETATAANGAEVALATEFTTLLALRFEIASRRQVAAAHAIVPLRDVERRLTMRRPFVVPVRVRTERMPWFEETMTVDCSGDGLKFRSNREYARGEFLIVSFESAATSPWLGVTESLLMVVRVESEPDVRRVAGCGLQDAAVRLPVLSSVLDFQFQQKLTIVVAVARMNREFAAADFVCGIRIWRTNRKIYF